MSINVHNEVLDRSVGRVALPLAAAVVAMVGALFVGDGAPDGDDAAPRRVQRERASCLWLAARDHGFYRVQSVVIDDEDHAHALLWDGFLGSIGREVCGVPCGDRATLVAALRATRADADRYFLGTP